MSGCEKSDAGLNVLSKTDAQRSALKNQRRLDSKNLMPERMSRTKLMRRLMLRYFCERDAALFLRVLFLRAPGTTI